MTAYFTGKSGARLAGTASLAAATRAAVRSCKAGDQVIAAVTRQVQIKFADSSRNPRHFQIHLLHSGSSAAKCPPRRAARFVSCGRQLQHARSAAAP